MLSSLRQGASRSGRASLCDQETSIKKLVELVRDSRKHDTVLHNTLVGSSASAGSIERANQEVAKQCRTSRSRAEEGYAIQLDMDHKLTPWLITHFQISATVQTTGRSSNSPRQYITRTLPRTLTTSGTSESGLGRAWRLTNTTPAPVLESSDVGRSRGAWERRGGRPGHWTSLSGCRGLQLQRSMPSGCRRCAACTSPPIAMSNMVVQRGCPACFGQAKVHSTECRARYEALLAQEDPAAAKARESAARTTGQIFEQYSSGCAGRGWHRSGYSHSPAPLVRQGTSSNSVVTEPMQSVVDGGGRRQRHRFQVADHS